MTTPPGRGGSDAPGRREGRPLAGDPRAALAELGGRLRRAGWEPTAQELAETLWLARFARPPAAPPAATPAGGDPATGGEPAPPRPAPTREELADRAERPRPLVERSPPVSLYAPARHSPTAGYTFPVRAPAVSSLSGLLEHERALRPLAAYRTALPTPFGDLDEEASADASARAGALRAVFAPSTRRQTEVQLLMDASPTTSVWRLTFEQLRQTFEQLGCFRDVQALYLHRGRDGTPLLGTGPDPGPAGLRPVDQRRDTSGRRITLVLSDCVGPLWQDGSAQRMLHDWSGGSPLAVVQPLPPRMWPRTALPAEPGTLVRAADGGGRVTFEPDGYGRTGLGDIPGALPVPVLLPTPAALGNWAGLLGGGGRRTARGAAAWVLPRHHAMPPPGGPPPGERDSRELLDAFLETASPGAVDLAVHLAAVPLVLPVIELVQRSMLPDTGPTELAEVLLSGLLERLPDGAATPGPRYQFAPGVQELLFHSLDEDTAELVLKHVSAYAAHRFGQGSRNFPALAVAELSGRRGAGATRNARPEPPDDPTAPQPDELFAQVPASVVRWFRPPPEERGRLDEAERLLEEWWNQRDARGLAHAQELAEAAHAADGGQRARLTLGRVLRARARSPEFARPHGNPAVPLHRAARLLGGDGLAERLERAATLHDLWHVDADPAHLMAAESALRGLPVPVPPEGRLRLGRVLLAHAAAVPAFRHRAREAVVELRAVSEELDANRNRAAETDERARRHRTEVLLDLVRALRLSEAPTGEQLRGLDRAAEEAAGSPELLLRCARERARVHRDAMQWGAADRAYAEAAELTWANSWERCELLAEMGEMRLTDAFDVNGAERILREALIGAPGDGPVTARLHLLLGRALALRWERARFLPDLYESCHQLEAAARQATDGEHEAEAWRLLAEARLAFPPREPPYGQARDAYHRALRRAGEAARGRGSVEAARALHGLGAMEERAGALGSALARYRAAAAEWNRLAGQFVRLPWPEVTATRECVARLESPGAPGPADPAGQDTHGDESM
ncbi:tetratricopeptide repeat protein [Streptomyces sp. AJS327]|uniref:SAV_2336 N-terminal domain-related protein n=1 Tax=Streptomyces sp. AJS327 TaxID=2545265 RepID=UPI0015DD7359|nr:SAV_2336 N-terminal domain-related protein [Streptomyces sp. AJS327]MBA0051544.1 tetratricopeptide repeat protein [Streptomyces sp. AJS327]